MLINQLSIIISRETDRVKIAELESIFIKITEYGRHRLPRNLADVITNISLKATDLSRINQDQKEELERWLAAIAENGLNSILPIMGTPEESFQNTRVQQANQFLQKGRELYAANNPSIMNFRWLAGLRVQLADGAQTTLYSGEGWPPAFSQAEFMALLWQARYQLAEIGQDALAHEFDWGDLPTDVGFSGKVLSLLELMGRRQNPNLNAIFLSAAINQLALKGARLL